MSDWGAHKHTRTRTLAHKNGETGEAKYLPALNLPSGLASHFPFSHISFSEFKSQFFAVFSSMGWSLLGLAWNLGLASWVWFWIRIWKCFTSAINYHLEAHCASPASRFQSWPAWLFTSLIMITLGLSLLITRTAVKWVFIRESQLPMDVFLWFPISVYTLCQKSFCHDLKWSLVNPLFYKIWS